MMKRNDMSFSRREMIKVSAACAVAGKSTAAQAGTSTSLSESNQTMAQVPSH
jgi:nitrous oxide reductase